jgi:hypothetical protein
MADFTSAGHLPPEPVANFRDNRLAHWASGDLDTLFSATRAHASLTNGRAPPPTSLSRVGTDPIFPSQPFHNGVSAKVANRAASLAAGGRRAMEALSSNPLQVVVWCTRNYHGCTHKTMTTSRTCCRIPSPSLVSNSVLRKLISWRSLLDALKSPVLTSTVGGLKLFARWVPLALSPVQPQPS